jgi:site-specific DNA-cytosine methylase
MMLMLDLCSGLGGASQAMRDRGWEVVTLDNDARFQPTIVADLRAWAWYGARPDLIWLSDPCTEFSRESMPWCRTGASPDLSIVLAGLRVIREATPRYWVRENVRGSIPWVRDILGAPRERHGPFFLWGSFPSPGVPHMRVRGKERYSSAQRAERARVPYALSTALATAIEGQMELAL